MFIDKTTIEGVYLIRPKIIKDERGFFARSFCKDELRDHDIETDIVQCNISFNLKTGTIRGMHYQCTPYEEAKFVSCPKGKIFDVVIDLRERSPTFFRSESFDICAKNHFSLYIPNGCAHGFATLEPDTLVYYQMTEFFHPECARGIRWNDPAFDISWPLVPMIISDRDASYPDYQKPGADDHE